MLGESISEVEFRKAEQKIYQELRVQNEEIRRLKASICEHDKALEFLADTPQKTKHDIMVPIGPLAFMPGHLIHTNEVTVLLGEGYFAERSAHQAAEIIDRRKKFIQSLLVKAEAEALRLSARTHTSDYARKTFLDGISSSCGESKLTEESDEEGEEDEDEEEEGQGFDYWSRKGFIGAWSENRVDEAHEESLNGSQVLQPVFEIIEPVGGGSGKVVRFENQDALDGLGNVAKR